MKYEELKKTDPPLSELGEKMQRIFLDLVTLLKKSKETQIQFNNGIIKTLAEKKELIVRDKIEWRRNQVKKLFREGYSQKEIAQKL